MKDVWYAAYGSNLSRERFDFYIKGGLPPGARAPYPGCLDRAAPIDARPWSLPGDLVFGKNSTTWHGGVAFLDSSASGQALGRVYLVAHGQLEDIVAQENRFDVGTITLRNLEPGRTLDLEKGFYPLVLTLGELEGHLVVTISDRLRDYRKPSIKYLSHLARGLRETYEMDDDAIVSYLASKRGIEGALSARELAAALR